jgi:hypothetical protein
MLVAQNTRQIWNFDKKFMGHPIVNCCACTFVDLVSCCARAFVEIVRCCARALLLTLFKYFIDTYIMWNAGALFQVTFCICWTTVEAIRTADSIGVWAASKFSTRSYTTGVLFRTRESVTRTVRNGGPIGSCVVLKWYLIDLQINTDYLRWQSTHKDSTAQDK